MTPEELARTLALQNAVKHKGTANPKALVGGMIKEFPEFKKKMPALMDDILDKTVKEVNALGLEKQEEELRKERPDFDKVEKKEGLKELPDVKGKVVMRFEPSPSGPLHIGHAYTFSLNLEYAKKYDGKCILRIADTNPENISEDAYKLLPEDACWLSDCELDIAIQSERMELYYNYALKLIEEKHAYVCECEADEFKKSKDKGIACPCRNLSPDEHAKRWKKMHTSYEQGAAVVRFKTDIADKNPAMRDFPLLRINEEEHPKQGKKYRVWPLMNFSVAIDDMDMGVTHTLRGKDHADNAKKQAKIHNALKHNTPTAISVGRINFDGFPVSCSKTRPRIESGEFTGWDDPRIPFLPALRRRGYQPQALRNYAIEVGVTKNDKSVHIDEFFKHINALNKELIDATANRYFFIADPVEITVQDAPEQEIELNLHPDSKKGGRKFMTKNSFFIAGKDVEAIAKMKKVRLMENMTMKVAKNSYSFDQKEYDKANTNTIIHWLPVEHHTQLLVKVQLLMPDGSTQHGLGEQGISELDEGTVVQFERVGFCRFDRKEGDTYIFYFAHL
ncbi:glutamate--tRNA ligase [Candidatus Woesearchaeota archaeon]|nr:glutamate--tRNA ligase [Candidatus Woesearchaeota archaeon]